MSIVAAPQVPPVKYEMQSLIIQMIFRDFIIIYRFQHKWTQSGWFKTKRSNFTITRIRKYFGIQFHAFYSSEYIFSIDFVLLNVVLHFRISLFFYLILCTKKVVSPFTCQKHHTRLFWYYIFKKNRKNNVFHFKLHYMI